MRYLLLFLVVLLIVDPVSSQNGPSLEGTWQLKSFVDHSQGSTDWTKNPSDILYQKHISGDYFTWVKFDLTNKKLLGMGGGSFFIDKQGHYVENVEFFFPPGASENGQSIPFEVGMKGKKWYHTGYAKVFDIGVEGETVVVDSTKIEEIWTPVKPSGNAKDLVGTWELMEYKENPEAGYLAYPDMIGYIKIITPTHFVWVKYDKEGDQIYASASGTYVSEEGKYAESILTHYPETQLIGTTIDFEKKLLGNQWKHMGTLPRPNGDKDIIDEFWRPLIEARSTANDFNMD